MMYRKFYIVNSTGAKYTLTEQNFKSFLNEPNGLGFQKTVNGYTIGNAMKVTSSNYNFMTIGGDVLFYDSREQAYQDYFDFIKFIALTPLKFYYEPPNTHTSYFCDCEITQLDKTEYSEGCLTCPIQIMMTSHWQDSNVTVIEVQNELTGEGKFYELERPYYYGGTTLSNIVINNNGSDEVGFTIEVEGEVTNPQWTISQNGEVYGSAKINGTYDKVKVVSIDGENEISLERNGSVITNPASFQDLSITGGVLTFIKLKTGTSTMVFTCGNIATFTGVVRISFSNAYISV